MDENNSDFNIVIRDTSNNIFKFVFFSFVDCEGNPSVHDIRDELNTLLNGYISVNYDKFKNLFLFTRTKATDASNNKIYLKNKTSANFLRFSKDYINKKIEIKTDGVYSYQRINVIYHQQLLII